MLRTRAWPDVVGYTTLVCLAACTPPPTSNAPIIQKYIAAECVPLSLTPKVHPHTREWDTKLSLGNGLQIVVTGAQLPGGRVNVSYPAIGREIVAADPGDYIYPSDVRLDPKAEILYVKAFGSPATRSTPQTWLFEYDIRREQISERRQITNGVLPPECPEILRDSAPDRSGQ